MHINHTSSTRGATSCSPCVECMFGISRDIPKQTPDTVSCNKCLHPGWIASENGVQLPWIMHKLISFALLFNEPNVEYLGLNSF